MNIAKVLIQGLKADLTPEEVERFEAAYLEIRAAVVKHKQAGPEAVLALATVEAELQDGDYDLDPEGAIDVRGT